MTLILLATLGLTLADDDEKRFAEHLAVLANSEASGYQRSSALLAIAKLKKLDDPRVTRAYEAFLKHEPYGYMPPGEYGERVGTLLHEVLDERVYSRSNFLLAAKLLEKQRLGSPVGNFLRRAYAIRTKWWHDKEIVAVLTTAVTGGKDPRQEFHPVTPNAEAELRLLYEKFNEKYNLRRRPPYERFKEGRLDGWKSYSYCLALLGDSRLEEIWKQGLTDQRPVGGRMEMMASLPPHPIPQRLCDVCLECLLLQHGVEPLTVLKEYDQGRVQKASFVDGGGLPAAKAANAAAYDAAIKDYDKIAKRYFK